MVERKLIYKEMKTLKIAFALIGFLTCMGACVDEGEEIANWKAGDSLLISGPGAAANQDTVSYYVQGFTVDKTYTWTLNNDAVTPIRQGEYVEVIFDQPGEYTLKVSDGSYEGTKIINVAE